MFVPFESIAPDARIWIFQSSKQLSKTDAEAAGDILRAFTENWAAHGAPLRASFDIRYDYFIILAADENVNETSGCSIDESVRVIKELEERFGTKLFDRQQTAFLSGDAIKLVALRDLKEKFRQGIWNESTLTFNNLVDVKKQLESQWIVPAAQTWLKRYIPVQKVSG